MFCIIEEQSFGLAAKFGNAKAVYLYREDQSGDAAYVQGNNIFGLRQNPRWYFTYSEYGEGDDGKAAAVEAAEQAFRDLVSAIAEDKPLNLSEFVMKPKAKPKVKPKASETEQPQPAE